MAKKYESKEINSSSQDTPSQRILLEEYQVLHADYINLRNEGLTRVNFFITAMSLTLSGVLIFASSKPPLSDNLFKLILVAPPVLLALMGLEIYSFLILRGIAIDRSLRGMARIRSYFVSLDPNIQNCFVSKLDDQPTTYLHRSSSRVRQSMEIIEGFLIGLIVAIGSTFLPNSSEPKIAIVIAAPLVTIVLLEIYAYWRLSNKYEAVEKELKQRLHPATAK